MILFERVKAFEDSVVLLSGDRSVTGKKLVERVTQFRSSHGELQSRRVTLACSDWYTCIVHLVALEGWAAEIFLADPLGGDLAELGSATHAICRDSGVELLTRSEAAQFSAEDSSTRWLIRTSGTTGTPKTIEHSVASLSRSFQVPSRGKDFRWALTYAPYRFAGLQVLLQALFCKQTLIVPEESNVDSIIRAILHNSVEAASGTPSFWRRFLMDPKSVEAGLKQITLGGEIADAPTLARLAITFPNARISHVYASTEAGVGFTVNDGKPGFPAAWLEETRRGVQLKISEKGNLLVKHQSMAQGAEIESRLTPEGFLDTFDLVEKNGKRILFLGRESGVINVGGNKVFPERVEEVLLTHPRVREAVVRPKPSSVLGQLVTAQVVIHTTDGSSEEQSTKEFLQKELLQWCRTRLQAYEVPMRFEFVQCAPITDTGKIERR